MTDLGLKNYECACCYGRYGSRKYGRITSSNAASIAADMKMTVAGNICPDCLAGVLGEIIERLSEWDPALAKEVVQYTIRRKRVLAWRRDAREARIEARMQDQAAELRRMVEESDAQIRHDTREAYLEARAERQMWAGQS